MSKLPFPEVILHQHMAVLGKTGSGKSSALRVIVEHLLDHKRRTCIIDPKGDWWGLKSSADGKSAGYPVICFGDFKEPRATDVPINQESGRHVAELIAGGNRPCIIGFRGWMPGQMTKFWLGFAPTMFNANTGELNVVIDEIQNFAPKGKVMDPEAGKSLHWTNRIMSEGRGIGLTFLIASQRAQKVHNDTLDNCETLVAMRTAHPRARESMAEWMNGNGDPLKAKEVLATLAQLKRGEAWIWSPENNFGPDRVQFPMFETFDSFAPPQLQKKVNQAGWSEVNLDQVREKLAIVIAEAKANDPRELKQEVARLKQELAKKHIDVKTSQPVADPKVVERAVAAAVKTATAPLLKRLIDIRRAATQVLNPMLGLQHAIEEELPVVPVVPIAPERHPRDLPPMPATPPRRPTALVSPDLFKAGNGNGDVDLSGPQLEILRRLAEFHAIGRSSVRLAWLAGSLSTTVRARGFEENLRRVRQFGLVDVASECARLTESGKDVAGEPAPVDVKTKVKEMLSGPQTELLETLDEVYPHEMPLETLAATHNTTVRARGFEENLRFLRSNELITVAQGAAKRAEWIA